MVAAEASEQELTISVASDPRAQAQIPRIRARAALLGTFATLFLSWHAGTPLFVAGVRAIVAGVCCYLVAWAATLQVWRTVIAAELRRAAAEAEEQR